MQIVHCRICDDPLLAQKGRYYLDGHSYCISCWDKTYMTETLLERRGAKAKSRFENKIGRLSMEK